MAIFKLISTMVLHHRKRSGLSQKELADLAGVGKTVIYDIEKGKDTVRFSTLAKVLTALNIRLDLSGPLSDEIHENDA